MKFVLLVVLSCCFLGVLRAQEHGEEGGEGGEEGASIVVPPCAISREKLDRAIYSLFPEGYNVTINCLSFDENGALYRGIISGVNGTGGPGTLRLVLRCTEGVIASMQSNQAVSGMEMEGTACLNCSDAVVAADICVGGNIPNENVCSMRPSSQFGQKSL